MKRKISAIITVIFVMAVCLLEPIGFKGNTANGASKPKLIETEFVITIAKQAYFNMYDNIQNVNESAVYTYKSSDKSVVTVDKKGVLTGVKAGKAKITVYQTYKKKKIKIGTCKITVKNSELANVVKKNGYEIYYEDVDTLQESISNVYGDYNFNNMAMWSELMNYFTWQAEYTYESSDSSIVKIDKEGNITFISKPGVSVNVTIKETYKKRTRVVGTFKLKVLSGKINKKKINVKLKQEIYPGKYVEEIDIYYLVVSRESDINKIDLNDIKDGSNEKDQQIISDVDKDGNWSGKLTAGKKGTVYFHYFNGKKPSKETYLGKIEVNIK